MYKELDGNTHALNRHLDEMDKHDAEEARFEAKVAETVDDLMTIGSGGPFYLYELVYQLLADEDGKAEIAVLVSQLIQSKDVAKTIMQVKASIRDEVDAKVREGTNA